MRHWFGYRYHEEGGVVTVADSFGALYRAYPDESGQGFLVLADVVEGPFDSLEAALTALYDRLLRTRHGIDYTRRPWPRFDPEPAAAPAVPSVKRNGKKVRP